jgi:DNA-binding NtrC family response regulator
MTGTLRVLVVDDEEVIRDILATLLEREGWHVTTASTAGRALTLFEADPYDVVLLDLMLPDRSGLDLMRDMRRRDPDSVIVIVTAYSSIEGAIEAMRDGAFHYIPKPFQNEEVLLTVRKGAETRRLTEENRRLKEELSRRFGLGRIVGKSETMRKVFDLVRLAGPSRSTILVEGESGTGKELVARAIHTHSPRAGGPFVTVNSGSMPTDLLESNLFGHVRGAFTGAVANKKGLFESAEGGSIFFDEIGTVGLETQAKLLRVIQEKEFMRVGSVETQKADVRIIAATNVDLKRHVSEGKFRDDLYYRLCVITISIPSLRERREDIPMIAEHFVRVYASENSKNITGIVPDAMRALLDYDWPGNVRELENAIERAVVLCSGGPIELDLLPESVLSPEHSDLPVRLPENGSTYKDLVEEYERRLVRTALRRTGGVQKRAAELLRMKPTTLHEIIKRLEIQNQTRETG